MFCFHFCFRFWLNFIEGPTLCGQYERNENFDSYAMQMFEVKNKKVRLKHSELYLAG